MPILDRLDPEHAPVVLQLPVLDLHDLPGARAALTEMYAQITTAAPDPAVTRTDRHAPGVPAYPDVHRGSSDPLPRPATPCPACTGSRAAATSSPPRTRTTNQIGWRSHLGDTDGTDRVFRYAAPARMDELAGLAPTTILTAELDLFVDEDITDAQRLIHAGVPTELYVHPAAHHGFDPQVPTAAVSRRLHADRDAALHRVFTTSAADTTVRRQTADASST